MITSAMFNPGTQNGITKAFERMLPSIKRVITFELRRDPRSIRGERAADAIAAAFVAFARLNELGKETLAYPTALARYAVRRVRSGRSIGTKQNSLDVLSAVAQRRHAFSTIQFDPETHICSELIVDRKCDPAAEAICRIDFGDWLGSLCRLKRRIAVALACGTSTNETAEQFRLSAARISQVRRELASSWWQFQSLPDAEPALG